MRVSRESFLAALESVQAGLSNRDIVEQSDCFVLGGGFARAFNDEVFCRAPTGLPGGVAGAVRAAPLLAVLRSLRDPNADGTGEDDPLDAEVAGPELVLRDRRGVTRMRLKAEVALAEGAVERPAAWRPLPDGFAEAVAAVGQCAGRDESAFGLTCVHVAPGWVEACDNFHLCRWLLTTGVSESTLVRHAALRHVPPLGFTETADTPGWLHFRAPSGLELACRRYAEEYRDLAPFLKFKGERVALPKSLDEAVERAKVFAEEADHKSVLVTLKAGRVRVQGVGESGRRSESRTLKYDGPELSFLAAPRLLADLIRRHPECVVSADRIRVEDPQGRWVYVACVVRPEALENRGG